MSEKPTASQIFEMSAERKKRAQEQQIEHDDFFQTYQDIIEKLNEHSAKYGAESSAKVALTSLGRYLVFYMSGGGVFPVDRMNMLSEFFKERVAFAIKEWNEYLTIEKPDGQG